MLVLREALWAAWVSFDPLGNAEVTSLASMIQGGTCDSGDASLDHPAKGPWATAGKRGKVAA
jgi:hypothetical protein